MTINTAKFHVNLIKNCKKWRYQVMHQIYCSTVRNSYIGIEFQYYFGIGEGFCVTKKDFIAIDFMNGDIIINDAIRILSQKKLQRVHTMFCSFDKTCQTGNVAEITKLLPKSLENIEMNYPISPDHFYALATNIQNDSAKLVLYINSLDLHLLERFVDIPPTQQECAYNLLLPLAKAGHPFEPPFIELPTDEDLEPTYEALRIVAAIHKPMPLMLEDAVA